MPPPALQERVEIVDNFGYIRWVIIDCHGHYTTTPPGVGAWRDAQIAALGAVGASGGGAPDGPFAVTDDEIRESIEGGQLRVQRERGIDVTLFSPRASWMGHHVGDAATSLDWTTRQNDLIKRVCDLFPGRFVPVAQLPQSPGAAIDSSVRELRRTVEELGFVAVNINPDPTGGYWTGPVLGDRYWWPLWEAMQELDVPGMLHVSQAENPFFQTTGSYYLSADTTFFVQALSSGFMKEQPGLRLIIPHGGGAIPFHWGRFQGMSVREGWDFDASTERIYFDTCVYHQPGIDLLLDVVPTERVLFGSEMLGAVRGDNPTTGSGWDDTGTYLEAAALSATDREQVYSGNARAVYPRLAAYLA
jgi:4-oxalmesaconate hydratase